VNVKLKRKALVKLALAAIVVLALVVSYFLLTDEGAPGYSPGNRWTWEVTRQELDPLTGNVRSERTYEQTLEYLGEETRGGHGVGIFKLTTPDRPTQYA
jgi:hypothetical protein